MICRGGSENIGVLLLKWYVLLRKDSSAKLAPHRLSVEVRCRVPHNAILEVARKKNGFLGRVGRCYARDGDW